ncbi:MAG: IPExxxVDY family protein [Bacteroidales bacterium]|nr:IPExxxVDY family protein [Bacteroidales bacterium]
MATRKKITRFSLEIPDDEITYSVFGLVTSEPDYRLSFSLNKKLKINLRRHDPIEITGPDGEKIQFSRFTDLSDHPAEFYTLAGNRTGKRLLSRKYNQVDYLFLKGGTRGSEGFNKLLASLRNLEGITAVFHIKETEINIDSILPH